MTAEETGVSVNFIAITLTCVRRIEASWDGAIRTFLIFKSLATIPSEPTSRLNFALKSIYFLTFHKLLPTYYSIWLYTKVATFNNFSKSILITNMRVIKCFDANFFLHHFIIGTVVIFICLLLSKRDINSFASFKLYFVIMFGVYK